MEVRKKVHMCEWVGCVCAHVCVCVCAWPQTEQEEASWINQEIKKFSLFFYFLINLFF